MLKRTPLMVAVAIALAVVGTALGTMPSGIVVTTFVRATLDANKPHGGVKAYSGDQVKLHTKGATDVAVQTITSPRGEFGLAQPSRRRVGGGSVRHGDAI